MSITLYGIANCDTVKKARLWLTEQGHAHVFHDFKKLGLERAIVAQWLTQLPWETLINRKGTTWRALSAERQGAIVDAASATELMLEYHSVIKRPVLQFAQHYHVGFAPAQYHTLFTPAA